MKGYGPGSSQRRALLRLIPAALVARLMPAQSESPILPIPPQEGFPDPKKRQNAIAAADYDENIKDARDLIDMAKAFEINLERDDKYVLSLNSLKKLDEIDRLTKRLRGRMKHV